MENKKVPPGGLEPPTLRSSVLRSPSWATRATKRKSDRVAKYDNTTYTKYT